VSLDGADAVVLSSFSSPLLISSSLFSTQAAVDLGKTPEQRRLKGEGNRMAWERGRLEF
jgi:hypothetical protein